MATKLVAKNRDNLTSSNTREVRAQGDVPAIVYGYKVEPQPIAVNSIELVKTVRDEGKNAIISLQVDNNTYDVMLHEFQVDPLKNEVVHADFYVVNMSQDVDVQVPIVLEGEAKGASEGGVVQQPLYELSLRAKPNNIPDQITVDISELEVGDSILVEDLKGSSKYEILEDDATAIVSVLVPDQEPEADTEEDSIEEEETIEQ
ncbi:50S ribosomal protein L25/general stress protein Ctc [Gracilibacillus marinus]|jgi:large subunit ribosomal protein L25|uniref:Large ribosomal subunit protein bL25 n=1 Tax=Gracilibacillus marinus TaxID=630535 RepID=A0ABV8VXR0_9BACI